VTALPEQLNRPKEKPAPHQQVERVDEVTEPSGRCQEHRHGEQQGRSLCRSACVVWWPANEKEDPHCNDRCRKERKDRNSRGWKRRGEQMADRGTGGEGSVLGEAQWVQHRVLNEGRRIPDQKGKHERHDDRAEPCEDPPHHRASSSIASGHDQERQERPGRLLDPRRQSEGDTGGDRARTSGEYEREKHQGQHGDVIASSHHEPRPCGEDQQHRRNREQALGGRVRQPKGKRASGYGRDKEDLSGVRGR
jgi:hypothetical protein